VTFPTGAWVAAHARKRDGPVRAAQAGKSREAGILDGKTFRSTIVLGLSVVLAAAAVACRPKPPPAPAAGHAPEIIAAAGAAPAVDGPTLKAIRDRRRLNCGVTTELPGFATRDVLGQWRGFDVDFCRAVAAAVLGDARAVHFVPDKIETRFATLQAGNVDLLARGGSWTFSRDVGFGLDFVGISYFDGQGFLAPKAKGYRSAQDLKNASVCVQTDTTAAQNLVEYLKSADLKAKSMVMDTDEDAWAAYQNGACQVLSANISTLAAFRSSLKSPQAHMILPDVISKEPTGPVVRQGDDQWADIVRWTLNAMILGEELGVDSKTVEQARGKPRSPEIGRLLSGDGYGEMMRLKDDWAFQVIRQVGNYQEVFDHNIGPNTPLGLARDENALWNAGRPGLLFSPPMR
jgi:general L-amino acid transport system substrate-binding protein